MYCIHTQINGGPGPMGFPLIRHCTYIYLYINICLGIYTGPNDIDLFQKWLSSYYLQ